MKVMEVDIGCEGEGGSEGGGGDGGGDGVGGGGGGEMAAAATLRWPASAAHKREEVRGIGHGQRVRQGQMHENRFNIVFKKRA